MSTHYIKVKDTDGKVHKVSTTDTSGKTTKDLIQIAAGVLSIAASLLTLESHGKL